jgi:hypothetical protein
MRNWILAIAVCVVFGSTLAPAGAARLSRDRSWSGGDRVPRSLGVLRVARQDRGVFIGVPLRPVLLMGIAF